MHPEQPGMGMDQMGEPVTESYRTPTQAESTVRSKDDSEIAGALSELTQRQAELRGAISELVDRLQAVLSVRDVDAQDEGFGVPENLAPLAEGLYERAQFALDTNKMVHELLARLAL